MLVDALLHDAGSNSKLGAGIDAQRLFVVVHVDGSNGLALADVKAHHVGNVVLALHVVIAEKIDVCGQSSATEAVHANVAFTLLLALLRRSVFVLNNGSYLAIRRNDATISGWIWGRHCEYRTCVVVSFSFCDKVENRLCAQQRCVTVDNNNGSLEATKSILNNLDGMTGAKTLSLGNIFKVREARKCRFSFISVVTYSHNDAVSASSNCSVDTPPNKGFI